ncbi:MULTISPECIES: peptidoglycan-binding protein [unclassified Streptomyces]|uniref:peptidoglycan-binding protein n=1 Tax=unclassified Streptomyces TaxID=2593676 RepID=UPI000F6EE4D1|nr:MULTISPECIES: peptidoglycan-binding protein [unclassified Streptomyces]AZM61425.1 peptidoglycan-binding protein [Streptomyces sp. WAC 01438]RSM98312.1 peptidoglycan-binding protein [Streptomyces sp. WAC 01420]
MLRNRVRVTVGVCASAVVLTVAGLASTAYVKSPQQVAAEAGPPAPDVLTVPVERRVLTDTVVIRGTVEAGRTIAVSSPGPSGKESVSPVVTKVMAAQGDSVEPATALVEISGRPLFALEGALPVYRDLRPGAHGDDVRQLQTALRERGFPVGGDTPGTFGPGTKEAVRKLYAALGYDPVPADPEGAQRLKEAERAVRDMERAWQDAEPGTDRDRAAEDLAEAREERAGARAVDGPMVPASEIVFLPELPARVDAVEAAVGAAPGGTLLSVSVGELVVRGALTAADKGLVRKGQKVDIFSELTGATATGKVTSVADRLSTPDAGPKGEGADPAEGRAAVPGSGASGYTVVVSPDRPLSADLVHQGVRLTVDAAASEGKVLVVPVGAVSAGADVRTTVTVLREGGRRERVDVRPGISGDGYVAVTPRTRGALAPGDRVVVGVAPAASSGARDEAGSEEPAR